ncbi:hypothetical protein DL93DRAFT_2228831 [Clavulina sp. PMI_390]|nr:hypothetical protein DL93DRAFT_2228831 [Clavulina sp. PMI_390]
MSTMTMAATTKALAKTSLAEYLAIYPYPAFLLSTQPDPVASTTYGSSLVALNPNGPCRELLAGNQRAQLADNALIEALHTVEAAKTFSFWVAAVSSASDSQEQQQHSLVLELNLRWIPSSEQAAPVKLHLVKARVDEDYWIITTIPLSTLPPPLTQLPSHSTSPFPPPPRSSTATKRISPNLHLGDLPAPAHYLPGLAAVPSSLLSSSSTPGLAAPRAVTGVRSLNSNSDPSSVEPTSKELPAGTLPHAAELHSISADFSSSVNEATTATDNASTTATAAAATSSTTYHTTHAMDDQAHTQTPAQQFALDHMNPSGSTTATLSRSRPASISSSTRATNASNASATYSTPFEKPLSAHAEISQMMDEHPWEKTVLGPREGWDESIKVLIAIMMECPYPMSIWYGPELNIFYNAAYADLAGKKHPALFGMAGAEAWKEVWDQMGPHVQGVLEGKSVARQDDLLMFERLGDQKSPEETYHSWTWIPIPNPRPNAQPPVVGLLNINFETTLKVVTARRLKVIQTICDRAMLAPTIIDFARNLLEVLEDAELEAPFAALYTCTATGGEEAAGSGSGTGSGNSSASASVSGRGSGSGNGSGSWSRRAKEGEGGTLSFRMSLIGSLGVPTPSPNDQSSQHSNEPPPLGRPWTSTSASKGGSGSSSNSTMTLGSNPFTPSHPMFPRAFHSRMVIPSVTTSMHAASTSAMAFPAGTASRPDINAQKRPNSTPQGQEERQSPRSYPLPPSPTSSFISDLADDGEPTPTPSTRDVRLSFTSSEPPEIDSLGELDAESSLTPTDSFQDSFPPSNALPTAPTESVEPTSQTHLPPQEETQYSEPQRFDWSPYIAEAMSLNTAVHVSSLPPSLMSNVGRTRGWRDPVSSAIVLPITSEGETSEAAVLILGCNPRRPFNAIYAEFIDVLRLALMGALNAVLGREAETQRANQLAQLDAAKTVFFSNASHELRTPLTLIDGPLLEAVAMLKERENDLKAPGEGEGQGAEMEGERKGGVSAASKIAGVRERLVLASRNSARLSRLIDSLMDFSKIEGGKLVGRFGPVMLAPFTADLASLFRSTIEKNGIEFNVDCDADDASIAYIDPEMWEKIVFNLIGNAFKYTLEGKITVRVRFSPLWATFQVEDSGVGIPPEDIDRVFERFHRVTNVSRSHEGTGIGLALTKELVRLHGGRITVTSLEQQRSTNTFPWDLPSSTDANSPDELDDRPHGSTFTIVIPMGHSHIPKTHLDDTVHTMSSRRRYARGIIDEAAQWGHGTPGSGEVQTPSDTTTASDELLGSLGSAEAVFFTREDVVLVVDDNTDMRQYIKSIFSHYCTVKEASNGEEALKLMTAGKVKPDAVVTDRMMPFLDGDGLLLAMRNSPELRGIPVVMVTAAAGEEAKLEGLLAGADDYVAKPFTAKQLLARTHLQLQIGKRRAQLETRFEASISHLRVLSELAPVGIFRADTDGRRRILAFRITWANPMWYELIEHEPNALLDDWLDYIVPESKQEVQEAWHKLCHQLTPRRLVMEFHFTTGRCVQAQFNVLDSQELGSPSILGTLTDISERRILQQTQLSIALEREAAARRQAEESETRRQEAEERRRAQELLIDVTSHELRQPVSAILNCASLVQENYRSLNAYLLEQVEEGVFHPKANLLETMKEDLEALDSIYQCGLSQERIANDVLSLSRMQLEVLSILPVDFILEKELQRICSPFQTELKMKSIQFDLVLGESVKALHASPVRMDRVRFAQIVTNLLSNAIKFTDISPQSTREIYVQVQVSSKPPLPNSALPSSTSIDDAPRPGEEHDGPIFIFVSVKDSGPGLKPEDLALLFQRFAQGSNSHEVFGGSGLGLFVSRRLCELMGGRIEVDSQYGQGAAFQFFVQGTMAKVSNNQGNGGKPELQTLSRHLSRPPRVLITEDNQINQKILNRQLNMGGCETVLASNGLEAIEAVKKFHGEEQTLFDVILMDCEMPVMSGYDATREIRRMESEGMFERNHIIALTGNARSAQIQSARDAGMDDVMIKPYKIEELLHVIRKRTASNSSRAPSPLPPPLPPPY